MARCHIRRLTALLLAVFAAALAAGCGSDSQSSFSSAAETKPVGIAQADPRLQAIYAQANRLLPGGRNAYRARLAELKGLPIVVNKWASWCGPCAAEFPFFQNQAKQRGATVAFLAVNTNDANDDARAFLSDFPVPFPSYEDGRAEIAADLKHVVPFPATGFYDRTGKLVYVHQGQYADEAELGRDIEKYALASGGRAQ